MVHVTLHCFKMLLFLLSAIEITTLHTHITKFTPNIEAKKHWPQIFSLTDKLYLHNFFHLVEIRIILFISNANVKKLFQRVPDKKSVSKINISCFRFFFFSFFLNTKINFGTKNFTIFKYNNSP